jgi:D-mannonate dehydratase
LDETLSHIGWNPNKLAGNSTPEGMYSLCTGFVGTEAAISFIDFIKNYEMQISAEDILNGKVKPTTLKDVPASTITGVIDKLSDHSKDNEWKAAQVKRVAAFAKELGGEFLVATFTAIQRANNLKNLMGLNKLIGKDVVALVNSAREVSRKK